MLEQRCEVFLQFNFVKMKHN